MKRILQFIVPFFIGVIVTVLLNLFCFDVHVVHGSSMSMSLYDGDIVIAQKMFMNDIDRGDIIILKNRQLNELMIKRVIGLPGETVQVDESGYFYIDGNKLSYEYQYPTVGLEYEYTDVNLSDSEYYVVGDNRYDSYDSRYFGPIDMSNIKSIAIFRLFPFELCR